jgi:hypothetical protein
MNLQTILFILTGIVTAASAFVAATPTPPPGSVWSEIYAGIEFAALVVGKAKDTGLLPAEPTSGSPNTMKNS